MVQAVDCDSNDRYAKSCVRHACSSFEWNAYKETEEKKREEQKVKMSNEGHVPKTSTAISTEYVYLLFVSHRVIANYSAKVRIIRLRYR